MTFYSVLTIYCTSAAVEVLPMKEKQEKESMFGVEIKQRPYIPMSEENYPTRSAKELVQAHKKALDKLAKM